MPPSMAYYFSTYPKLLIMNQNDNRNQQDQDKMNQQMPHGEQDKQQPAQSQKSNNDQEEGLKKSDLPDSSNESQGTTGSGQRQDSN